MEKAIKAEKKKNKEEKNSLLFQDIHVYSFTLVRAVLQIPKITETSVSKISDIL